jgi:DNA replication protein DnaC
LNSIGEAMKGIHRRPRIVLPDEFFCDECNYLQDPNEPRVTDHLKEHYPESLTTYGELVALGCRCKAAEEQAEDNSKRMWREANLPLRKDSRGPRTMKNFQTVAGTIEMTKAVEKFLRDGDPPILVLVGALGGGKTHMLEHIVRATLGQGKSARYETAEGLLERLRHTFSAREDGDLTDVKAWYRSFDMLAVDDLGAQKVEEWGAGHMTGIIDERYADGSKLVVVSNFVSREEIESRWGERLYSRLFDNHTGTVKQVFVEAQDYRNRGKR